MLSKHPILSTKNITNIEAPIFESETLSMISLGLKFGLFTLEWVTKTVDTKLFTIFYVRLCVGRRVSHADVEAFSVLQNQLYLQK